MNPISRRVWLLLSLLLLGLGFVPLAAYAVPPAPPAGATFQVLVGHGNQLVATTQCGVFEQAAGGTAWNRIGGFDKQIIDIDQLMGNELFALGVSASAEAGLEFLRRAPGGAWERLTTAPASPVKIAASSRAAHLYVATYDPPRLLRSNDRGQTWQEVYRARSGDYIFDVAVANPPSSRADMVVLIVGGDQETPHRVIVSLDNGATWRSVPGDRAATGFGALFVNYERDTVYIATSGTYATRIERVQERSDRLETVMLPEGRGTLPYPVSALGAFRSSLVLSLNQPTNQATVIGTQQGQKWTYHTFDQGNVYGISDLAFLPPAGDPAGEPVLVAATHSGIFQRPAGAAAWSRLEAQPLGCALPAPAPAPPSGNPFAPVPHQSNMSTRLYFPETQHTLSHEFKLFWEQNGGLPIFGYPLSEEFPERNADVDQVFTTQYLQRERLEFHPENHVPYRVLLGRLGDELLQRQGRDWRLEDDLTNHWGNMACRRFDVGGEQRQVCGPFIEYWELHGLNLDGRPEIVYEESLALFGLPLTGVRVETNRAGDAVLTQWFERARFEWHPNNPAPYKVLLGLLGDEIVAGRR